MSALILAPDHDPFAFLNCKSHYRTAAKEPSKPRQNTNKAEPTLVEIDDCRALRIPTTLDRSGHCHRPGVLIGAWHGKGHTLLPL